jgi:ZIP family zinc transporter
MPKRSVNGVNYKYAVGHTFSKDRHTLFDYPQLLLLGAFSGLTIFLGLPLAVFQSVSPRMKGFLNALAIGILIFLTVDVLSHAWESAAGVASLAFVGKSSVADAVLDLIALFGGIAVGLLGLTWYETQYMKESPAQSPIAHTNQTGSSGAGYRKQELQLLQQVNAYRFATMIAIGIGAHNFSEGLAIGQSYASGAIGLALVLMIGFAAHNATEGFGIAGPLTGLSKRPSLRFLAVTGMIGGGPTFLGTAIGSLWSSTLVYIFFLAIAGGALVYVSMLMYDSGRRQATNAVLMAGLFIGLFAGFITDLIITLGGA